MDNLECRRWLFVLLAIVLGQIGIHNFYAGHNFRGICQLVLTLATFGWLSWFMFVLNVCEAIFVTRDADGNKLR